MMISVGLWVIPLVVTILAFWTAWIKRRTGKLAGLFNTAYYVMALLVSIISWLGWFIIT